MFNYMDVCVVEAVNRDDCVFEWPNSIVYETALLSQYAYAEFTQTSAYKRL